MKWLMDKEANDDINAESPLKRILLTVGALLLGASVVAPFYLARIERTSAGSRIWRTITTHDLPNYMPMLEQFDKVLKSGVFYPRWTPDFNAGYGTATANFYPPGTFYLASLINVAVDNWFITLFILCALSLGASCIAFYLLARNFYSRIASAVAAVLYALFPYHQLDLYWRGAIPEYVGFAFLPLILYFAYKLGKKSDFRYYAGLGLFYGLYLLIHMPVGYLFSYTLALYAVLWSIRERDRTIGLRIAGGLAIGLLISAIYWLPAALEGKYIYEWASEFFPYHSSYITMIPALGAFDKHIQEVFNYNGLALIVTVVSLKILSKSWAVNSHVEDSQDKKESSGLDQQTRLWLILGIVTPFMSTSFSIYISRLIPKIQIAVPPFRWLAISSLFTALLIAATIDLLRRTHGIRPRYELASKAALVMAIALNVWLTAHGIILDAFTKQTQNAAVGFSDSGFTPKDATRPGEMPNTPSVMIRPEGGASEILKWLPTYREIAVRVDEPSEVRLKTYNFPGWTARLDGKVVPLLSDQDGVQQVSVPPGIHNIQTSFESTFPRIAGALLSIVGLTMVVGLTIADRLQRRSSTQKESVAAKSPTGIGDPALPERSKISAPITSQLMRFGIGGLVIIAGAVIVLITFMRSDFGGAGNTSNSGKTETTSSTPGQNEPKAAGSTQLYLPGKESVEVGVDQNAVGELIAAMSTNNKAALDSLVESGRVLRINNSTRVQVMENTAGQARVRILEGNYIMREGWVPERWIR
jgi:6-pyruvoyl-tetrahydropterin synthase related domain